MRVSTAFKRLLRLPGASVIDVSFSGEGVVVTVRLRRRRRVCSACGQTGRLEIHDRRIKRWRHLDLGATRCWIECELRLLRCRTCGVRMEPVPWARAGAQHTRRRRRKRTVTITPSRPNSTPITDAPGSRSIRLNAVLTRTSPSLKSR